MPGVPCVAVVPGEIVLAPVPGVPCVTPVATVAPVPAVAPVTPVVPVPGVSVVTLLMMIDVVEPEIVGGIVPLVTTVVASDGV